VGSFPWARVLRWAGVLIAAIVVASAISYVLVWYGPDVIARHDVGLVTGPQRAIRLQQARDAARGRLLTLGAGLFAAGALVYTALNFRLSREGQVTDRYTKAIEQLGSDKLDVRIGGIYALERVARDSARDHPVVMEVLAAFIRVHSREQWPVLESDGEAVPERRTRPDVQAALRVIGRRDATHDRLLIELDDAELYGADLAVTNLRGALLRGAHLEGANLDSAHLEGAYLWRAHLGGARFDYAHLDGAHLSGGDFRGARFWGAHLNHADLGNLDMGDGSLVKARFDGVDFSRADASAIFSGAQLHGANFTEANLAEADLAEADLTDADLTGADLTGANLRDADLTGAKFDGVVPEGWVRDPDTGRLQPSDVQQEGQPNGAADGAAS
jgi:uncharacterized protein YjbI with pentapeptide repeats